jgi:HK97 family phage portal protein
MFSRRSRDDGVEDRALDAQTVPPSMLTSTPGGASVTPSTAMGIADAYACIRALADAAASLPLHSYRRTDAGRERLEGGTADLLTSPAPATTQANLVGQMVAHLNLFGNAYVGKFRNAAGQVDQIAMLHPERVVPELRAGRPIYAVLDGQGGRTVHGVDDITHIKALSIDGLVGLSPVRQCRIALGLSQTLQEHASSFFENGARPAGILRLNRFGTPPPGVASGEGTDDLQTLRDAWNVSHRGPRNAHRVAVVSGEVEFIPLSMPMDDVEFLEQRKLSAVEVARVFRVPPHIIGASSGDSLTYSTVESQALDFVKFSLRPFLVTIEQALSADRDLFGPRTYCEFLLSALLRADSKTRADVYAQALDPITGWMDVDEVRALENLPPRTQPAPTVAPVAPTVAP